MDISVIVCTFNRCESLEETLKSFAVQEVDNTINWEIIVVDNNSKDKTKEVVCSFSGIFGSRLRYIFEPKQGLSFARNRGIRESESDVIAFTDDDCIVSPTWLKEIRIAFQKQNCSGLGGKIIPIWDGVIPPSWYGKQGKYSIRGGIVEYDKGNSAFIYDFGVSSLPIGANMAFRRNLFTKHGMFKENLGLCGKKLKMGEDREFCLRLIKAGEILGYCPQAIVKHPVEKQRLTERFLAGWYYWYGYATSIFKQSKKVKLIFGVRTYLIKSLGINLFNWIFFFVCKDRQKKIYYKLNFLFCLGSIRGDLCYK